MEKLSGKTQRKNWEVKLDRKTSVEKLVKNLNILKKLRTRISQSTQGPTAQLYNSVQKRFQNNLFRAGDLLLLKKPFWIFKSSFSLLGTKLASYQQKNYPTFLMFFQFCPFYGQKMQEKVSKS